MELQEKHELLIKSLFLRIISGILPTLTRQSVMYLRPLSSSASANQCFSIKVNGALLIT